MIEIRYCNNIDAARIMLVANKLNIKFAPNGSGKSTIARALFLRIQNEQDPLSELIPFKLRKENPENKRPEVSGIGEFRSVMCFNEVYVNQFVFRSEELVSNSFDIFIRTDIYRENEQEIEELICRIKNLFVENQELETLIATLKEMGNAFKLTKTGLSKSTMGMKGLSLGNKIQHIPSELKPYESFIQSENCVDWINWQTNGCKYFELSENCPFCTSPVAEKRELIKKVGQEYDKNTIKNLIAIIDVIEKLGDFFSPEAKEKLKVITTLKDGLENEHEAFLVSVKTEIDNFTDNLEKLRTLSAFQFKDGEKVAEKLPAYKLDLQFFAELKSERMRKAIAPINESIDQVIQKAGQLQGKINQQRKQMKITIDQHQKDINGFLAYAGYRYQVEIVGEGEQSQLKLRHVDHEEHLSGGSQHLSFGERNAFAIVLFMYECLSKKPDLIILDDPISSFDKNKKYAILEMLFRRDADSCLKNKTVLMLTHDVEPIIDTTKSLAQKFSNQTVASFLQLRDDCITDCPIEGNDIQTFTQICKKALASDKDNIVKLIYLRRHLEIINERDDAYQVISNVLHKRERACDTRQPKGPDGNYPEMESAKFLAGCSEVTDQLEGFSYSVFLNRVKDKNVLKMLYRNSANGYEKLQIFRMFDLDIENSVIQKFINETYHIENEFVCQLDPAKFDTVPEYVVLECNRFLQQLEAPDFY